MDEAARTVGELVAHLLAFDQSLPVVVSYDAGCASGEVVDVEVTTRYEGGQTVALVVD